jgi:hypothetical protein
MDSRHNGGTGLESIPDDFNTEHVETNVDA